jgi:hypothetical protein
MTILQKYSKSEDAALDASWLMSEGIDATVIEDSGYGGNAFGFIEGSIRIEVPEEQLEQAQELLVAKLAAPMDGEMPV